MKNSYTISLAIVKEADEYPIGNCSRVVFQRRIKVTSNGYAILRITNNSNNPKDAFSPDNSNDPYDKRISKPGDMTR